MNKILIVNRFPFKSSSIDTLSNEHEICQCGSYEEALAFISLYKKSCSLVLLCDESSYLSPLCIHKIIKNESADIPVLLLHSEASITDIFNGKLSDKGIASYDDFKRIQGVFSTLNA